MATPLSQNLRGFAAAQPGPRARNPVVRALIARLTPGRAGRHQDERRRRQADARDLDQRVRECGEW